MVRCIALLTLLGFVPLSAADFAPVLSGHYPTNGATGVPINTKILIAPIPVWFGTLDLSLFQDQARLDADIGSGFGGTRTLSPRRPLAPSTRYRVVVDYGLKALGLTYSFEFTTGPGPDASGPQFVRFDPSPGTGGSAGGFTVWFNEALFDPGDSVSLRDDAGNPLLIRNTLLTPDFHGVIVIPDRVTSGLVLHVDPTKVRDAAGNFGQGAAVEAAYPYSGGRNKVAAMFPADGQSSLPTNTAVQILFNNSLRTFPVEPTIQWVRPDGGRVDFSVSFFAESRGVLLKPRSLLSRETAYTITVTPALKDNAGNPAEPFSATFVTGAGPDLEPASVTGASSFVSTAPLNVALSFTSNKPFTSVATAQAAYFGAVAARVELSSDARTIAFRPERLLTPLTRYRMSWPEMFDGTGNPLRPALSELVTGVGVDSQAPRLVATSPGDGTSGFGPEAAIELVFDEPVILSPGTIRLLRGEVNVPVKVQLAFDNRSATVTPDTALAGDAEYTIEIGPVIDFAGNRSDPRTLRFSTGALRGGAAPRLVRVSPENGAARVAVHTPVRFEFDRPLSPIQRYDAVSVQNDSQRPVRFATSVSGNELAVTPLGGWPPNTGLYVWVRARDVSHVAPIAPNGATAFITAESEDTTPPAVERAEPAPGSVLSVEQPAVLLRFSKRILESTVNGGSLVAYSTAARIFPEISVSPEGDAAWVVFPPEVQGKVSIYALPGIADTAGNRLIPFDASYEIRGLLEVRDRPALAHVRPPDSREPFPQEAGITLILRSAVPLEQIQSSVVVSANLTPVPGKWRRVYDPRVVRFEPDSPFPPGSRITTEDAGYVRFRVRPQAPSGLMPLRFNTIGMQPGDVIEIEYDRDFTDPSGLVYLLDWIQTVEATASRVRPRMLRITPSAPLKPDGSYKLVFGPGSASFYDEGYYPLREIPLSFSQNRDRPATGMRRVYPPPNSLDIALNALISAAFSGRINVMSVTAETVRVSANGRDLPGHFRFWEKRTGFTFTPWEVLPPDTAVRVDINGVEDPAGRSLPPFLFEFRTGTQLDLEKPQVVYGSSRQTEFVPGAGHQFTFNEPVSPEILDALPPDTGLSEDLQTLTIFLAPDTPRGREISVVTGVQDGCGNVGDAVRADGVVAFDPDDAPPRLVSLFPAEGAAGLPRNVMIAAVFSESVANSRPGNIRLYDGTEEVPLAWEPNDSGLLKARPVLPLRAFTEYTLVMEGVRDAAGNVLEGRIASRFSTSGDVDLTGPQVVRFPVALLPLNAAPAVRFSEPVLFATLAGRVTLRETGPQGRTVPLDLRLEEDGRLLRATPQTALQPGVQYTLEIASAEDYAGNPLSNGFSQTFTMAYAEDREPPRVSVSPQDDTTEVPIYAAIRVAFSEPVELLDQAVVRVFDGSRMVLGSTFSSASTLHTFRPYLPLEPSRTYTINVASARDVAGNISAPFSSSFRTGAALPSGPFALVSTDPPTGAADVPLDVPIRFNFNRPVEPFGAAALRILAGQTWIPSTVTVMQNSALVTPSVPLPPLTTITAGAFNQRIEDLLGSPLTGASSVTFTTRAGADATPPKLLSIAPEPGTLLVPLPRTLALRFSEPVTGLPEGLRVLSGADPLYWLRYSYGEDPAEIYIDLQQVPPGTVLTVASTSALRDFAGNRAEPFSVEYPVMEALDGLPRVVSMQPPEYARVAPGRVPITLRFDRQMNPASVLASVRVTQDGRLVTGQTEMIEDNRAVRFTPDLAFIAGTQIDVFVLTTAMDTGGRPFGARYRRYFFIEGASSSALAIAHTSVVRGAAAGPLAVEFNQPLAPGSVHDATVWVTDVARNTRVPGRVSVEDGSVLIFTPDAAMESGRDYKLAIGAGVQDANGGPWAGQEIVFKASRGVSDALPVESVWSEESSSGRVIRIRFREAVNPLAAHKTGLVRTDGQPVHFTSRYAIEGNEWTLVPTELWDGTAPLRLVLPDGTAVLVAPAPNR